MKKSELNILSVGTLSAFALPSLRMLCREGYPVAGVITQPDRPAGRGHKLISARKNRGGNGLSARLPV